MKRGRSRGACALVATAAAAGCGSEADHQPAMEPPAVCSAGEHRAETGGCCPAGTLAGGEGCQPAGIAPDGCAPGFEHAGDSGCMPLRPALPCPEGRLAPLGETACRPVAECGEGTWGSIAVEPDTVFVDAAAAGPGTGSPTDPFPTIAAAVDAAPPGAIVAIAAGTYEENIAISGKPVRLWGRCPEQVAIVGLAQSTAAVFITTGAGGSSVRGVALTGNDSGVVVSGSLDVTIEQVWIHHTARRGVGAEDAYGPTSIAVADSLIEAAEDSGIFLAGASARIERVVVRNSAPRDETDFGRGVEAQSSDFPAHAEVYATLIDGTHDIGIAVDGGELLLDGSLVTSTQPDFLTGQFGRGLNVQGNPAHRSRAMVTRSVVDGSHEAGVFVDGSDLELVGSVIRGTRPLPTGSGRGLYLSEDLDAGHPALARLEEVVIEHNHEAGISVSGASFEAVRTIVAGTLPVNERYGRGLHAQVFPGGSPCHAVLRGCRLVDNHEFGVLSASAVVVLEATSVAATRPVAAGFGDGITSWAVTQGSEVELSACRVEANARAGVSAFGATARLADTLLACNPIALAGEAYAGRAPVIEDRGGNRCACGDGEQACQVQQSQLAPPQPLP